MLFARPLAELIAQFEKLPGVGPKSAQRLAYHVVRMAEDDVRRFSEALTNVKASISFCTKCQNLSERETCEICEDPRRESRTVCVVAEPRDIVAIERINEYKGAYHVLHGLLSPMDGIGPEDIKIKELLARIESVTEEVIVATNPTVEGDATALYLARLIKPLGIKVTRIAHGMPAGAELDYADTATLHSALEFRREI